jgi:hypothetical protein
MEFEHYVAAILCASLVGLCGLGVYNNKVDNDAIVTLVERGSDPIAASCAIRPTVRIAGACAVLAHKK